MDGIDPYEVAKMHSPRLWDGTFIGVLRRDSRMSEEEAAKAADRLRNKRVEAAREWVTAIEKCLADRNAQ